jgi:hypothetical protein
LRAQGDIQAAVAVYREALETAEGLSAQDQIVPLADLFYALSLQKDFDGALAIYQKRVDTARQIASENPADKRGRDHDEVA